MNKYTVIYNFSTKGKKKYFFSVCLKYCLKVPEASLSCIRGYLGQRLQQNYSEPL